MRCGSVFEHMQILLYWTICIFLQINLNPTGNLTSNLQSEIRTLSFHHVSSKVKCQGNKLASTSLENETQMLKYETENWQNKIKNLLKLQKSCNVGGNIEG